jgi:hypothetical protein
MIYVLGQRRGMSPDGMMRLMSKMDDGSTSALLGAPNRLVRPKKIPRLRQCAGMSPDEISPAGDER